jgi:nicotinate-nucleotide adenylyltransferase
VIAIYGGTFDPIHNGHLHVARQLIQSGHVSKIVLVPAGQPQLKDAPRASADDRLEMCHLAVKEIQAREKFPIEVSDVEIKRNGPSYAIDTVLEIKRLNPDENLAWIIGSDAYRRVDQWHRSDELKELISFIVIERPEKRDSEKESERDFDDSEEFDALDISAIEISSTEIRKRLQHGESIEKLVPSSVARYIAEKGLYAAA